MGHLVMQSKQIQLTLRNLNWTVELLGAGVAQSVWCLTTDWTTGVRSPTDAEDISTSLCVQTGSGAHSSSCTVGTGGKAWPGRDVDHSPHLVPRLRMSRSYTSSHPLRFHGV
jgi:hypothetical protein